MTSPLTIASYLAPNWFWFYEAVAAAIDRNLSTQTQISQHWCDPLNDSALLNAEIDFAFICGLPFTRHHQTEPSRFQPLVAPVMKSPRYHDQPVYFADVIVRVDRDIQQFSDLSDRIFCYNDPGSNSGYYLLLHYLVEQQLPVNFFRQFVQSGSHQRSIQWVIENRADCAAIDSIVLEQELQNHPHLASQLRVIASIGPVPAPPLIGQPLSLFAPVRSLLLNPDQPLQSAMKQAGVARFAAVDANDYKPLLQRFNAVLAAGYDIALDTASR